jgi:indolepyruvate decarboxylase
MPSVADFLVERLENAGLKHAFTVPGDYILYFLKNLSDSKKVQVVNSTDEGHAGFAADAYARVKGVGCVVTTYSVGALKLCNAIAGAYAEKSPVILISGSPGVKERDEGFMLHHMVRSFDNQVKIFEKITCCSVVLDDPQTAGFKIDLALEKLHYHKQPVYVELPRDVAHKPIKYDVYHQGTPSAPETDATVLEEALKEVFPWLDDAKRPVILAGVQVSRFNLGSQLIRFAERHGIPVATTLLSKSVVDEKHRLFLGVYAGTMSSQVVKEYVESSDCLLILGEMVTDVMCGYSPVRFDAGSVISSSVEGLKVKNHTFKNVGFRDFCSTLFKADLRRHSPPQYTLPDPGRYAARPDAKLTVARFVEKVNSLLTDPHLAVVADIGESLFGAFQLSVSQHCFMCPAFHASMGFAIPGALGVALARPDVRPVVLVGDGAFQMTCGEISSILEHKLNPVIFVLNNRGYATERVMLDGPFNNLRDWQYHKVTEMLGGGKGFRVETEGELEAAVRAALASETVSVINVVVSPDDISKALRRLAEAVGKRLK